MGDQSTQRRTFWLVVGILGGGACIALTLAGSLLALLWVLSVEGVRASVNTLLIASIMTIGLVLGLPLALQAWAAWQGRPSRPFNPARVWWLWLALVPALLTLVVTGFAVGQLPLASDLLLPPIHVLAMSILPLLVLGLVGWGLRGMGGSRREVIAAMASGGLLGTGASAAGEIFLGLAAATIIVTAVAVATPDGPEQISALVSTLEDPAVTETLFDNPGFLLSPAIIISAVGALGVVVPLIEETAKTLAGGIVGRWVRPHPARAFLWGVVGGVGFALVENLFYGASGVAEDWPFIFITRLGTTAMHCFTSGLVGWGWGQLWTARRPLRLLGAYVAAVAAHGLWNAIVVGIAFLSLSALARPEDVIWVPLAGLSILALLGMLALMTVTFIAVLPLIGWKLASQAERSREKAADSKEAPTPAPLEASTRWR